MTVKMEMTLPDPPEGYEYTGEVRRLDYGDLYTERDIAKAWSPSGPSNSVYPVLRKVPVYERVMVEDLGVEMAFVRGDACVHQHATERGQKIWENAAVIGVFRSATDELWSFVVKTEDGRYIHDVRNVEVAHK